MWFKGCNYRWIETCSKISEDIPILLPKIVRISFKTSDSMLTLLQMSSESFADVFRLCLKCVSWNFPFLKAFCSTARIYQFQLQLILGRLQKIVTLRFLLKMFTKQEGPLESVSYHKLCILVN